MGEIRPFAILLISHVGCFLHWKFEYMVEKAIKGFAGKYRISIFLTVTKSSQMTCQRY